MWCLRCRYTTGMLLATLSILILINKASASAETPNLEVLTKLLIAEENIVRLISSDHKKSEGVDEFLLSWRSRFNELIPRRKDGESPEIFNEMFQRLYNDVVIKTEDRSEDEYFEAVLERLVGNPVHVYTLLDRLVNMLPWLRTGLGEELDTQIEEIMGSLQVPDDSDMEGAFRRTADGWHVSRRNLAEATKPFEGVDSDVKRAP